MKKTIVIATNMEENIFCSIIDGSQKICVLTAQNFFFNGLFQKQLFHRAVGSFFMVVVGGGGLGGGGLSKNVGHHGWTTTKIKKKTPAKAP